MSVAILFLHHSVNHIVNNHLARLKSFNPDIPIFTVGFNSDNLLEGSHAVEINQSWIPDCEILQSKTKKQLGCITPRPDILILDFIDKHQHLGHEKYLIVEWDTYSNSSIKDFYGESLNKDFFCSGSVETKDIKNWYWYDFFEEKSQDMDNLSAIHPVCGAFFSSKLLNNMLNLLKNNIGLYDNLTEEATLGTLIKSCGQNFDLPFGSISYYIHHRLNASYNGNIEKSGIYHPVKDTVLSLLYEEKKVLGKGAEIGVHLGYNAFMILKNYSGHLHLVDPWETLPETEYHDGTNNRDRTKDYNECISRLSNFSERISIYKEKSLEACKKIEDESLDFVYIDANHSYDYVKADLEAWYPKVRKGGVVSGDDFVQEDYSNQSLLKPNGKDIVIGDYGSFGVNPALQDFCSKKGIDFKHGYSSFSQWYFIK